MTESDERSSTGEVEAKTNRSTTILLALLASLVTGTVCLYIGSKMQKDLPDKQEISASLGNGPAVSKRGSLEWLSAHALGDNTIADIVAQTMPAIVNLNLDPILPSEADSKSPPNSASTSRAIPFGQYYRRSVGSGLIIRSDGYILTSAHVIKPRMHIKITLNDKRSFEGNWIGKDSFTDLALVKIDAKDLPVAHFGVSKNVRAGDWAIAIGSPLGFDHTVTLGIVSAVGRSLADLNNHVDLIQTDAAINPGSSGGPLLNTQGEVIAISSAVRNDAQNISFAVPIDVAREVAATLIDQGSNIKRPYLGIHMQDMNSYYASQVGSKISEGVLVSSVVPNSPCELAGIGQYDIITQVNGANVKSASQVRDVVRTLKPGEVLEITFVRRNSEPERRKVTVGDYPEE